MGVMGGGGGGGAGECVRVCLFLCFCRGGGGGPVCNNCIHTLLKLSQSVPEGSTEHPSPEAGSNLICFTCKPLSHRCQFKVQISTFRPKNMSSTENT